MSFTTQLNTLHQRLLEAVRDESGVAIVESSYTLDQLLSDLDNAEDVGELVDELLAYDQEELYCSYDGNHFNHWLDTLEEAQEPLNLVPLPPRGIDPYEIPPLYEDATRDPPPYVELPPY